MLSMRIHPRGVGAALVIGTLVFASTQTAQAAPPPYDPAIDVELFQYAIGPKTFFTVSDAETADKKQLAMDALITFVSNPFTVYNVSTQNNNTITGPRDRVVTSLTEMQITGAYGISDKLQLGVNLPVIFTLQGNGLDPTTGMADANGLAVTGLGDALIEGKALLYRNKAFRLGAALGITLPTSYGSDGSQFIGDNLPTGRPKLDLQYDIGRVSLGLNAGVLLRKPRTIYASTVGQQFMWGAGAAVHVTERFSLVAEAFGRSSLTAFDVDTSPLIIEGGLRLHATTSVSVVLGGGAGVIKGIGSPDAEFFLSLGYAPDIRDTDGDGIPNSRDKCPLIPEDKDGFQDEDGCPDDDNDGDRNPDTTDKCPNQAEDIDGFEDDDGCPDLDNDKDGIPDLQDKCPMEPEDGKPPYPHDGCPADKRDSDGDGIMDDEDKCPLEEEDMDGFEDGDGCPDLDNDGDGIPDAKDKCPLCPEDKDGFQDEDGCPDLDNDHDGIEDSKDKCPLEPETVNGVADDDGCPDTGGAQLVRLEDDTLIVDRAPTLAGRGLAPAGDLIADEMGLVMAGHPEVSKWLIAVGGVNAADAKKLGDAVKARILSKRSALLRDEQIQIVGRAGAAKIVALVQERADPNGAPVCPAGLLAHERPALAAKKGAAPVTDNATPAPAPDVTPAPAATPAPEPEISMDAPAIADRDGDGIADADDKCPDQPETKNGYLDDDGCPDEVPAALKAFSGNIQGVNFKSGSAEILPDSLKILDGAAKAFADFPDLKVEIQGHTDDVAPGKGQKFKSNLELSQARAEAVKTYLVSKGVAEGKLTAKGYGDTVPLVAPKTVKGAALNAARTKNRRVEFKIK